MKIELNLVSNVVLEGLDFRDYPDMCDAYVVSADYGDREMTDDEVEALNVDYFEYVSELARNSMY
jgi:hypothetical protein